MIRLLPILMLGQVVIMKDDVPVARETKNLNFSGSPITCVPYKNSVKCTITASDGGTTAGGAPVDAGYVVLSGHSSGSTNERVLTAGTNIALSTATPGQVSVSVTGSVPTANALAADPGDCTAGQYATAIATSGNLTCAQVAYSQLSGTPTIPTDISGAGYWTKTTEANLSNEVAMGSLGTGLVINTTTTGVPTIYAGATCPAGFAYSVNASGALSCSIADPTVGGTGLNTIDVNQIAVGTATDTMTAKTLPSCSNATTSKLLYNDSTQTFSCGTDQTGGAGSSNFVEVEVDFGAAGNDTASTVVTGQTWVTGTSKIVCSPTMLSTTDRAEGVEDILVEDIDVAVHTRVVSTGFTITAHAGQGRTYGKYLFHCTGG